MMKKERVDVILVDDSQTMRLMLEGILQANRISYFTVATATEAMELLDRVEPRILIVDYVLPGMDGVEFFNAVSNQMSPLRYTILLSECENIHLDELARTNGFSECIHKSEGLDYLLARIREVLMNMDKDDAFVLIVEDSISQATRLRYIIEKEGLPCRLTRDGHDAMGLMKTYLPRLVVSDIRMPTMDGFELCAAMKKNPELQSIPVVLLTSLSSLRDIVGALQVGADYYFPKDADDAYIVGKVKELFGVSSHQEHVDPFTIDIFGETFSIAVTKQRLFDFLFSTCELAQHQNMTLFQQQRELHRRQKSLRELALTDELTGLKNRRAFFESAEREFERFQRYNAAFAVLMMDVDHFKAVNDTYGHAVGDSAIRMVGDLIGKMLRNVDVLARIGGDEFVVVLVQVDIASAMEIANRIRKSIAQTSDPSIPGSESLTMSLGMTLSTEADTNFEKILKRADDAMYEAKHSGKNRVSVLPHDLITDTQREDSSD